MTYEIRLKRSAAKELKKLPKAVAKRILVKIYLLADDPTPASSKKLVGRPGYRLRVGDYRVLYHIDNDILIIDVVKVGHRRDVYD